MSELAEQQNRDHAKLANQEAIDRETPGTLAWMRATGQVGPSDTVKIVLSRVTGEGRYAVVKRSEPAFLNVSQIFPRIEFED